MIRAKAFRNAAGQERWDGIIQYSEDVGDDNFRQRIEILLTDGMQRKGTLQNLIDYLSSGDTIDDFLEDFPTVSREQALAALDWVREALTSPAADDVARQGRAAAIEFFDYHAQGIRLAQWLTSTR